MNTGKIRKLTPLGYEQLTGLNLASKLSPPNGTVMALIRCEAQNVRWRDDDGTNATDADPTATVGMLMIPSDEAMVYTGLLGQLKFIEVAVGGILNVSYYG